MRAREENSTTVVVPTVRSTSIFHHHKVRQVLGDKRKKSTETNIRFKKTPKFAWITRIYPHSLDVEYGRTAQPIAPP